MAHVNRNWTIRGRQAPQPQQAHSTRSPLPPQPRFSRVLSCTQHVLPELHSSTAQSSNTNSLREALTKAPHAMAQSQLTIRGPVCHSRSQARRRQHALTAGSHASCSAAQSAAPSTASMSCTARLHSLATLTASERRSQASHAMAQQQLTIAEGASATATAAAGTLSPCSPLPPTLQPRAQLHPPRPS